MTTPDEKLRALLAAATERRPLPWPLVESDGSRDEYWGEWAQIGPVYLPGDGTESATKLIVAAVNALPGLLDERDEWTIERAVGQEQLEYLLSRVATLEAALRAIARWEMPETGKFWPNLDGSPSNRPMSYGACWGSNGERDVIHRIARTALGTALGEQP